MLDLAHPDADTIQETLDIYRGGYWKLFVHRIEYIEPLSVGEFCDTVGMMLIGMGLMKLGVISAARSATLYATLAVVGLALGLPLHAFAACWAYSRGFDPINIAWISATYDPGRLAIALAYIGLVMLIVRAGILPRLTSSLAAVGRMASHQLFGNHADLYDALQRLWLRAVWLASPIPALFRGARRLGSQLVISPVWFRFFLFGPAEWLWRSLTYWKAQPLWRR